MRNLKKIENTLDDNQVLTLNNFKNLSISSSVLENESPFKILVKNGDHVKINQPIMQNTDGQQILASVSGKVQVKLKQEDKNELTYFVDIENDFKSETLDLQINIKNKKDLINSVKNYGIINKNFFIYKYLEIVKDTLKINCFDDVFIYNNFTLFKCYFKDIKFALKKLKQILKFEKVEFYVSKNNLEIVKNLKNQSDKIFKKRPKQNALDLFDLFKLANLFKGDIFNKEIISITGKALKENRVCFVLNGAKINDIIELQGGFVQDIEEIENYKYTAMVAFNDELVLKDKIKKCKDLNDKQKPIKMLTEKQEEAKLNLYNKREEYYLKYLNTLSACFISYFKNKVAIKNFERNINSTVYGLHFLSKKQFH